MVFAGILAGGTGSRMGTGRPKQFLKVGGLPVLLRTLDAFCAVSEFEIIFLAVVAEWEDYTRSLIGEYSGACGMDDRVRVIVGGGDRAESLLRVIDALQAFGGGDDDILVTHDGVRPFVSERIIRENITAARHGGCAGTAIPTTDTILHSADGSRVTDVPPRGELYRAQTPQSVQVGAYLSCLSALRESTRSEVTDVCGVFTRAGRTVDIVMGDDRNIKITTPFDLLVAETIVGESRKEQSRV